MKAWAWMAIVPILGSLAQAESLGDVARRERERREKKRAVAEATVIREEELAAAPGKASKGTFNPAAGSTGGRANAGVTQPSASSTGNRGGANTEVDIRRAAARERLEASYEAIRATAFLLLQAVSQYVPCEGVIPASRSCQARLSNIGNLVWSVASSMEDAEDAARQGWLTPGEVRDARRSHGMADSSWDELVRVVHRYRR